MPTRESVSATSALTALSNEMKALRKQVAQWAPFSTVPANVLCSIFVLVASLPARELAVVLVNRMGVRRNCWQLSAMTKCANRFIAKCWSVHELCWPTSTSEAIAIRRAFPVTGLRLKWLLARSLFSDFDSTFPQPSPSLHWCVSTD